MKRLSTFYILSLVALTCLSGCTKQSHLEQNLSVDEVSSEDTSDKQNSDSNTTSNDKVSSDKSSQKESLEESLEESSKALPKKETLPSSFKKYTTSQLEAQIKYGLAPIFDAASFSKYSVMLDQIHSRMIDFDDAGVKQLKAFTDELAQLRGTVYASRILSLKCKEFRDSKCDVVMEFARAYSPAGADPADTANHLYTMLKDANEYLRQSVVLKCIVEDNVLKIELPPGHWYR